MMLIEGCIKDPARGTWSHDADRRMYQGPCEGNLVLIEGCIKDPARGTWSCTLIFLLTGLRIYTGEFKAQDPT